MKNMKKFKTMLVVLLSCSFLLSGCGNYMLDLTPEQNALITEYAAGLLLKYDKNHKSKILSDTQIEKEQEKRRILEEEALKRADNKTEKEAEQADSQNKDGADSTEVVEQNMQDIDLASFLDLEGFRIEYQSYEVNQSYPNSEAENLYLSMDATPGNNLVILHFNITNVSEVSEVCDILSKKIRCGVSINDGPKKNVLVTMLPNDLSVFQAQVGPEPVDTVLIVEMKSEEIEVIENMTLSIKYNGETISGSLQ